MHTLWIDMHAINCDVSFMLFLKLCVYKNIAKFGAKLDVLLQNRFEISSTTSMYLSLHHPRFLGNRILHILSLSKIDSIHQAKYKENGKRYMMMTKLSLETTKTIGNETQKIISSLGELEYSIITKLLLDMCTKA